MEEQKSVQIELNKELEVQQPVQKVTNIVEIERKQSILDKVASRFNVDPGIFRKTLQETVFRGATNEQTVALLIVADQYGLNPFTKEIYAYPSKGGGIIPVVGIDGWLRIINDHPMFNGLETTYDEANESCTCAIHRKDRSHPTVVTEYIKECKRNTDPWNNSPKRMIRHKAIIQCARIAFSFAGIKDEDEAKIIRDAEVIETKLSDSKDVMLEQIINLYNEKSFCLDEESKKAIERVISNKEIRSYQKTLTFLRSA